MRDDQAAAACLCLAAQLVQTGCTPRPARQSEPTVQAIARHLGTVDPEQRGPLVEEIQRLVGGALRFSDWERLVQVLTQLEPRQRAAVLCWARALIGQTFAAGEREGTWDEAAEHSDKRFRVVMALKRVRASDLRAFVCETLQFFAGSMNLADRCGVVEALAAMSVKQRRGFLPFCTQLRLADAAGEDRRWLVKIAAACPASGRAAFVRQFHALCREAMTQRDWRCILEALTGIHAHDRPSFIDFVAAVERLRAGDFGASNRARITQSLASVVPDARASFVRLLERHLSVNMSEQTAVHLVVALVTSEDRDGFSQRLPDLLARNTDGPTLLALARDPQETHVEHLNRLRENFLRCDGVQPRLAAPQDTENVMDASRQRDADEAIKRLLDRFSNSAACSQAVDTWVARVQATAPAVPANAAMWHAFAQHMTGFTVKNPMLQQLTLAMQTPPLDGQIPTAWFAGLAQVTRRPDCRRSIETATLASLSGHVSSASPVAVWVGHLRQADGWVSGEPVDELQAFVRHLERFEAAHIPVLGRVRGATKATEWGNAVRVLITPKRPGDLSHAIVEDAALNRLCGAVCLAIEQAPPAARELLRHSLMLALAQCIEDDGHRVCAVGQRQRLINVLEAQSCTPEQMMTALCRAFAGEYPNASSQQIDDFVQRAHHEAASLFGTTSRHYADFVADLKQYVEKWLKPAAAAPSAPGSGSQG